MGGHGSPLSHLECDLSAGAVARIDIAGGCSHVLLDPRRRPRSCHPDPTPTLHRCRRLGRPPRPGGDEGRVSL